jgi:photosystem II stability/assembly factor-like uncharacterized protein
MLRYLRFFTLCLMVVGLAASGSSLLGQSQIGPIATEFEDLHFRSIGPATMSGRTSSLAVFEANPAVFYIGTAHGGVWKTTSNGAMFEGQFQDNGLISIGAVAVSQLNPDLVWAGTGESNNRQSTSWGDGVYKSTDGGKTWRNMGLRDSKHIHKIAIDRQDNNIVFVGATGALFGPGGDRGLYKTTDGGATWKRVLFVDDDTGINDVVQSVSDRNTLYASTYQRRRSQCCMNGGGPGSGIWKSTDLGEKWTRLTNGIPAGSLGRIGLDVYRRSSNIVYASIEAEGGGGRGGGGGAAPDPAAAGGGGGRGGRGGGGGAVDPTAGRGGAAAPAGGALQAGGQSGLYRSDDGGASWRRVNAANPRPMYFSKVAIDPSNPDRVYMGGVNLHMTNDGGQSMVTNAAQSIHSDFHTIWIDPNNPNHLKIGGDGGVAQSYDMSRTWTQLANVPLALFYHISYDMETPYNVCGGLQDNYTWCGPSQVRFARGIMNYDWFQVQGGDGFIGIPDLRDSRIIYSESQDGNIQRKNKITGESKNIRPTAANVLPATDGQGLRWNWDTPVTLSPHSSGVLYAAANRVFKSTDRGDSWIAISPELTANRNRAEIVTMGVVGSQIRIATNDGIQSWGTIVSFAESPRQAGVYYTGTDDGTASGSKDEGKTWTNITKNMPGFPEGAWVSEVVPSRYDAATVYITVDAHRLNNYGTFIWVSNDYGATFRSLNGNLKTEVVKTLIEDPKNQDVLYIGTETGIFLTLDRGKSWRRLTANLPTVRVDEMAIHPRDNALIVGTHGRGAWILDHLEPIQEYTAAQAADAKLFSVPNGMQWRTKDDRNDEFWGHNFFAGENPPEQAVIQFHLKRAVGDVKLKITDAAGRELRELNAAGRNQPGFQTVCWDMRVQPIGAIGGAPAPGGGGRGGGGQGGRGGAPSGGPGGGMTGVPTPMPVSGVDPRNPCGGGGFGGGALSGPLVLPGTYNVALVIDGKTVETKPMKVVTDPALQLSAVEQKRYYDTVMELHDLQRRASEMTNTLGPLYTNMLEVAGKLGGMSTVPAAVKTQFDTANKEFDGIRVKFGVPPTLGGGAAGGGGGGGGRGGGPPPNPADLAAMVGTVKSQILMFHDVPSDTLVKRAADLRVSLPKAIAEANAFILTKAMPLSQTLKKYDVALTVPSPVK